MENLGCPCVRIPSQHCWYAPKERKPNIFGTSFAAETAGNVSIWSQIHLRGFTLDFPSGFTLLALPLPRHPQGSSYLPIVWVWLSLALPSTICVPCPSVFFCNCTSLLDFHLQLAIANATAYCHACLFRERYLISFLPLISEGHSYICHLGMRVLGLPGSRFPLNNSMLL